MDRSRVRELHNITHVGNLPSILQRGILSHHRARNLQHSSVADAGVQARRAAVRIPGGMPLHRYACLYFDARNAMLYRLLGTAPLAVLAVDPRVLDLEGVVVSDRNAASGTALFRPAPQGIAVLDEGEVFAEWWTESRDAMQKRCAEVLVPYRVDRSLILHAYVPDEAAHDQLMRDVHPYAPRVQVNGHLFFKGLGR